MEVIDTFWEKEWYNLSFEITLAAMWSAKGIWKDKEEREPGRPDRRWDTREDSLLGAYP